MDFFSPINPHKKTTIKSVKTTRSSQIDINPNASSFFEGEDLVWDFDKKKQEFIDHMDFLQSLTVEEETLYKKWKQLKEFNNSSDIVNLGLLKDQIWRPTDITNRDLTIQEIANIKPVIEIVSDPVSHELWMGIRHMVHSSSWATGIGRLILLIVRDENTNGILGIASIASDVIRIKVRDDHIGWTDENKFQDQKLVHTAIGSTILPTQPFGYNFLGGKLIASLLCTKIVRDAWKEKFGDTLVGMTTTSLYGGHSMYQRIPWWKSVGKTAGKISIKPDDDRYGEWVNWLKVNKPEEYEKSMYARVGSVEKVGEVYQWIFDGKVMFEAPTRKEVKKYLDKQAYILHTSNKVVDPLARLTLPPSGPKQTLINHIYKNLGIVQTKYQHGFTRGTYFSSFYENTREFLRNEITEDELVPLKKLDGDVDTITDWWKEKAIRRYENLLKDGRIKPEILFYRRMIQMRTWEEVKKEYLGDIGR